VPAVHAYPGYFDSPVNTGSQTVSGLGFQPKIIFFFGANHGLGGSDQDDYHRYMGAAISSTAQHAWGVEPLHATSPSATVVAHSNNHCIYVPAASGGRILEAQLVAINADGFTVTWPKVYNAASIRQYYWALGGDTLEVALGTAQALTSNGLQSITTVGFQPDLLICHEGVGSNTMPLDSTSFATSGGIGFGTGAGNQFFSGWRSNTADAAQNSATYQKSGIVLSFPNVAGSGPFREAAIDSFLSDGFRLNWTTTNATAAYYFWIALKGVSVKALSFTATPGAGNNQVISSIGFSPELVWLQSSNKPAAATSQAHNRMSWGVTDGTRKWSIWTGDRDLGVTNGATISATRADVTRVFRMGAENATGPSVDTEAAIDTIALGADDITIHYDVTTVTGQEIQALIFGEYTAPPPPDPPPPPPPPPDPPPLGLIRFTLIVEVDFTGEGVWTDITDDLRDAGIELAARRGMRGGGIGDRVAQTGTLAFAMNNYPSSDETALGYYTPGHNFARSGWRLGLALRMRIQYQELDIVMWRGRIDNVVPEPGIMGDRLVHVIAVDWMDEAASFALENAQTQTNKRSDEVFAAIIAACPVQPPAIQTDVGMGTFAYALDSTRSESMTATSEFARLASSELGYVFVNKSGAIVFEGRRRRGAQAAAENQFVFTRTVDALPSPRDRKSISNRVRVVTHPRRVETSPVVLYRLVQPQELGPGEEYKPFGGYVDPNQRASRVGASSTVPLVSGTDYAANMNADGSGADMTSSLIVTANTTGNGVSFYVQNTSGSTIYLTKLQVRGYALYDYEQAVMQAEDEHSRMRYGLRVIDFDMPYESNGIVGQSAAYYILGITKEPAHAAHSMTFIANDNDDLMRQAMNREISDRVYISEPATGLLGSRAYYVNGTSFTISQGIMRMTFTLAPADQNVYWLLAVPGASELGVTTRLGFGIFQGHIDVAAVNTHVDVAHVDTAHGDVLHGDSHTDAAHSDGAHGDVAHSDTAHGDGSHGDSAAVSVHDDTAHSDQSHVDQHSDVYSGHFDTPHNDYFYFPNGVATHVDQPHEDYTPHSDSHSDTPHYDESHRDNHADAPHTDSSHSDTSHADAVHTDSGHGDTAHGDVAHADSAHSDTAHLDTAHTDQHGDTGHGDQFG
jgi:hypothetical protein